MSVDIFFVEVFLFFWKDAEPRSLYMFGIDICQIVGEDVVCTITLGYACRPAGTDLS